MLYALNRAGPLGHSFVPRAERCPDRIFTAFKIVRVGDARPDARASEFRYLLPENQSAEEEKPDDDENPCLGLSFACLARARGIAK